MRTRRATWILALAVGGLLPAMAMAQDDAVVIGRQDRPPLFTLDPFRGSVGFRGFYDQVSTQTNGQKADATTWLLTQSLSLTDSGNVVSRDFMRWYGTVTASFFEEGQTTIDGQNNSTGIFDTFDLHADMLKNTPFPVTAYAQRSETYVDRTFAALLKSTATDYGTTVRYDSPSLPSSLSIGHTSVTQSDLGGNTQFTADSNQISAQTSFEPLERQRISLNYGFSQNTQDNPGTLTNNFETQNALINHAWSIDPNARFTLTEEASYSEETGLFPNKLLNFSEALRMNLTNYLDAQLDYRLIDQDSSNHEGTDLPTSTTHLTSQNISGGVTHHLFESLTTTATAGASFNSTDFTNRVGNGSSDSNTYFGAINSNYTKKLFLGELGANLGVGFNTSDNSAIAAEQTILGDRQTFNDPQPIVLTQSGVDINSLAVYDASGTRLLIRGIDYTVRRVGNTVQISRILGSNIEGGDTVRLNYLLMPRSAYTSDTTTLNAGANYLFQEGMLKGLNLYARYFQSDQTISSTSSTLLPDNIRDTLVGTDYQVWKLEFRAEGEDRESSLAPFQALRFSARYADKLDARTSLELDVSQTFVDYPSDGSRVTLTAAGGQMSYEVMRDLVARAIVRWRNEDDSVQGRTQGIEEELRVEYKLRQTEMYMGLRHTNLDTFGGTNESLFLTAGLIRNF